MRLVQNVQIVIILKDILINFPDFIESLKKASPQPSPEGKGVTKNEGRKTKAYFVATKSRIVFRRLIKPNRGAAYFVATKRSLFRSDEVANRIS